MPHHRRRLQQRKPPFANCWPTGKSKPSLDQAKEYHKKQNTAASGSAVPGNGIQLLSAAIRTVVRECQEIAPEQLGQLRQHIAIRCATADLNKGEVTRAMGGAPPIADF